MRLLIQSMILCMICIILITPLNAQDLSYQGQMSFWLSANQRTEKFAQIGIRYIPSFSLFTPFADEYSFDIEASLKAFSIAYFRSSDKPFNEQDMSPYRAWMRFSASQYEIRLGLQKINFGSATVFRPLMWFDMIDPRDPLQITTGVYGLLGRYYFLNNTNIWIWALIGNDNPKGWELFPTAKWQPELGARIQFPVFNGEAALSYHRRIMNLGSVAAMFPLPYDTLVSEQRFAFDGKWDIEVGFWIETSIVHHESELLLYDWEQALNIGIDYTFDIGNGLNVLTEYFILENTDKIFQSGEGASFAALSMNYPLGLLDRIGAIVYIDLESDDLYRFLSLQRTYDQWSFYLFAFWNPDEYKLDTNSRESNQFAGKGIQLMVVLNH